MTELKPCPFCGSDYVVVTEQFPRFHDGITTYFVVCNICGGRTAGREATFDAVKAWNRRADE